MTFVSGAALTAAQLNTHLRDNLMETAPAKAYNAGAYFVVSRPNGIVERLPKASRIATSQSTSSNEWTDLSTPGPTVTVTSGTQVLVFISAYMQNSGTNGLSKASFDVSGDTERDPWMSSELRMDGLVAANAVRYASCTLAQGLTSGGVNTFTMKYLVGSGTGTWQDRILIALPL
jgi:hypothetical protein